MSLRPHRYAIRVPPLRQNASTRERERASERRRGRDYEKRRAKGGGRRHRDSERKRGEEREEERSEKRRAGGLPSESRGERRRARIGGRAFRWRGTAEIANQTRSAAKDRRLLVAAFCCDQRRLLPLLCQSPHLRSDPLSRRTARGRAKGEGEKSGALPCTHPPLSLTSPLPLCSLLSLALKFFVCLWRLSTQPPHGGQRKKKRERKTQTQQQRLFPSLDRIRRYVARSSSPRGGSGADDLPAMYAAVALSAAGLSLIHI